MSKKIVILGALGYLGTELCKIYSGESWFNNIVALDSRFVSKRISQLKDWNIKFYQGAILDKERILVRRHSTYFFLAQVYLLRLIHQCESKLRGSNCLWHCRLDSYSLCISTKKTIYTLMPS